MSAKEISNEGDNRLHEEMTEIRELLKVLIQSQTKLAEAQENIQNQILEQAKSQENIQHQILEQSKSQEHNQHQMLEQAKSQENIQNQILEVLRNNSAGNKQQDDDDLDGDDDDDDDEQSSEVEDVVRAEYYPDRNELLFKGDYEKTIEFLKNNPEALKQGVTDACHTVLHVAIYEKREMMLVQEIVQLMSPDILEYKSSNFGYTALHHAAMYGNTEAAEWMVKKNGRLQLIADNDGYTPLDLAIFNVSARQKEMVEYLYSVTIDAVPSLYSDDGYGADLLCRLIEASFYGGVTNTTLDTALCLIQRFPEYIMKKSGAFEMCAIEMIVRRPFAFRSGIKLSWWQQFIYSLIQVDVNSTRIQQVLESVNRDEENPLPENINYTKAEESSSATFGGIITLYLTRAPCIQRLYKQKLVHQQAFALIKQMLEELDDATTDTQLVDFITNNPNIMKVAVKHGITEFVAEFLDKFDFMIWYGVSGERTLIQLAIKERKELIVNLICETGDKLTDKTDLVTKVDEHGNTILHYAARLASAEQLSLVSGAALQMQLEMQWFKGVESIIRESDRCKRNHKGEVAQFIFTEAHKDLMKEGQEWLKDTSGSCMIVAALIATVAFAAAFTVPGGNISDSQSTLNGTPVFLGKPSFTVFAVADALALFSSITSVLMFLAIYTSRYAEIDFLKSLPQKLIFGLATLFISMVAILVAFGASLFIIVGSSIVQAFIPITLFSCFPLGLFAWLQLPLFVEMVRSTYWGSMFQKHRYMNPSSVKRDNKLRKKKKEN